MDTISTTTAATCFVAWDTQTEQTHTDRAAAEDGGHQEPPPRDSIFDSHTLQIVFSLACEYCETVVGRLARAPLERVFGGYSNKPFHDVEAVAASSTGVWMDIYWIRRRRR